MINPYAFDLNYVTVNGIASPGRARIQGAGAPYNWEIRQGYGMSGATVADGRGHDTPALFVGGEGTNRRTRQWRTGEH